MRTRASNPFTLGVASGYPKEDSVVLWTRLAPDPLNGGGMGAAEDIEIPLEIATDSSFTNVVQTTWAIAEARYAHSVHHVVTGLSPNTHYWYRFSYGGYSATGRTLTAGNCDDVKFVFVNCQNSQEGFYPVYRDIAEDSSLDLVVHLGDYIYESAPAAGGPGSKGRRPRWTSHPSATGTRVTRWTGTCRPRTRRIPGSSPGTSTRSRTTTRAILPGTDQAAFTRKRAGSYQAYYEHMPLPPDFLQPEPFDDVTLYGKVSYGDLLQFLILDVRQYRTLQPAATG